MFFMAGAATSVLDILGSLQGGSGAQKSSAANAASSNQSPFDIPTATTAATGASAGATGAAPTGNTGGCWSCTETMTALLTVQSQSTAGAAEGTGAVGSDVFGTIEQLLKSLENQIGAGQGTTGSDGTSDATQGADSTQGSQGAHHHHASGIEQLLQALDGQIGNGQGATAAHGSTANSDPTGTLGIASGVGFPFSPQFALPSDGGSAGSSTSGSGTLPVNPLGRLMNLQAQMFAAATAGRNLSTVA
jgi:hypothetical protein